MLINVKLLLLTEGCEYDMLHIMSFMVCLKRLYREVIKQSSVREQMPIALTYNFFLII